MKEVPQVRQARYIDGRTDEVLVLTAIDDATLLFNANITVQVADFNKYFRLVQHVST